ncbi:MAG: cytochrome c biogenesis protein CcsA [Ignavibacteriales bacterium]|nr:cytochrome c biogenesis protein CcsA [Ignavibacteriales bacterium]
MSKIFKYLLGVILTFVIIVGFSFPMVANPQHWYEFPIIPGLEEKARNIFFHVPMAWVSVIAFLTSLVFSVQYLRTRDYQNDIKSVSAAGLGFVFCVLATVTGAIWAKFNWGAFWNWDPRQTSIFILLLIYGAYFALRSAIDNEEKRAQLSAAYSIIAGITVPFFIFVMPRMMSGLHPGSAGDAQGKGPLFESKGIAPNMRVLFYLSGLCFAALFFWMWNLRVRVETLLWKKQELA